jgi:hypothetical protein
MAIALKEELVLLCEGTADKAFFKTLIRERQNMPRFDIPFPESREDLGDGKSPLGGRDNIDRMLRDIRVPIGFRKIKGILIAVDSANSPAATFDFVCGKIRQAPGYSVPAALSAPSLRSDTSPSIGIICVPDNDRPGGIETLYAEEIESTRPWIIECIMAFLSCGEIKALEWSSEKKDKARFHSMIAALHENDPSRSASMIWKQRDGAPLLMNIHAQCFDRIASRLRDFAAIVGAAQNGG